MARVFQNVDYKWQAALIVALGLFLSILDGTIVSVALPAMRQDFHTNFNSITWVVSAYLLAQAAVIPITGYLTDRTGTKNIFLVAMGIFIVGSLLCAVAWSEQALIAARVIQGIGGGALFPTSFAIAYRAFPRHEWGRATAIIGVPVLVAPSIGPLLGGYLTSTFDWRAIFLINLPIGLVGLGLAAAILRGHAEDGVADEPVMGRFDVAGFVLAMVCFTVLVYGFTEAGINGWGNSTVVRALVISAILLILLVVVELRVSSPVLDIRIFRYPTFSRALVLLWVVAGFYYGSLFLLPYYFEKVQGVSALTTGEIMISQGLAAAIGIAAGGELYNRLGPRPLATVGIGCLALSGIGFTHLGVATSGLSLQFWFVLRGLGLGLTSTPLQNLALSVVDRRDLARGTSLVNVTRQVFSAAGVAALAAYVVQRAASHTSAAVASLHSAKPSNQIAAACAGHPSALAGCIQRHAVTAGLNDAFLLGLIICSTAVVLAVMVGRDPSIEALKAGTPTPVGEELPPLSGETVGISQPEPSASVQIVAPQGER